MRLISLKKRHINDELVSRHFLTNDLKNLLEKIEKLKSNSKENKIMENLINSGLNDLKNEIKKMSEDEIIIEKPYEIVDIVEKILEFNQ